MPDILPSNAPALSATSDGLLSKPTPPPTSASASPADIAAGRAVTEAAPTTPAQAPAEAAAAATPATTATPATAQPDAAAAEVKPGDATEPARNPDGTFAKPEKPDPAGVTKRIAELTAAREQLGRARDAEKARADAAQARLDEAIKRLEATPPPAPAARPRREAFDTPDAYDAALVDWAGKQAAATATDAAAAKAKADAEAAAKATADATKASADAEQAKVAQAVAKTWTERRAKAVAEMPDFEAVAENPDVQVSGVMVQAILGAENGPAIAYHLGKNPTEAARIALLPPGEAIFAMGQLAATLARPVAAAVTRAPAPIKPVGSNTPAVRKTAAEMSMAEYAESRNAQIKSARPQMRIGTAR